MSSALRSSRAKGTPPTCLQTPPLEVVARPRGVAAPMGLGAVTTMGVDLDVDPVPIHLEVATPTMLDALVHLLTLLRVI
jgi:hypothetical protein